jgi:Tn3 transposase DDE domain
VFGTGKYPEFELEAHDTNTHASTEVNFAAFAMLGRRFCRRIRGLSRIVASMV